MNDKNRQTLNDVFDVVPSKETGVYEYKSSAVTVSPTDSIEEKMNSVEKKILQNFSDLIETGIGAIEDMSDIAKSTESARDFEVLGNMIKSIADINTQIVDAIDKIDKVKQRANGPGNNGSTTVNQTAVFVGTTKDLSAMLANLQNGELE